MFEHGMVVFTRHSKRVIIFMAPVQNDNLCMKIVPCSNSTVASRAIRRYPRGYVSN